MTTIFAEKLVSLTKLRLRCVQKPGSTNFTEA